MALKDLVVRGPMPRQIRQEPAYRPIPIDDTNWMYPLPDGLTVVHEVRDGERYIRTDTIKIKWVDVGIALGHRKQQRTRKFTRSA